MTWHWSLWLIAGGLAMLALGIFGALRYRRFLARATRAQGTVSQLVEDGSGEYPMVEFSAAGEVIVFRSRLGGGRGAYRVGESVPVAYDPTEPKRAVIESRARARLFLMVIALGVGLAIMGTVFNFAFPSLERAIVARDAAIDRFLGLVRSGDLAGARASAGRDHKFDEAYLRAHVPGSSRFEAQSSSTSHTSACVAGALLPSRTRLVLELVAESGQWKVRRAGLQDPCESQLD